MNLLGSIHWFPIYSNRQGKYTLAGLEGLDVFFNADFIGWLEEGGNGVVGDWGLDELDVPSLSWLVLSPLVSPRASSSSCNVDVCGLSD